MIKIELHLQVLHPGIKFGFNLTKWKFGHSVYQNQHGKWAAFHFGPFNISFLWDSDFWN